MTWIKIIRANNIEVTDRNPTCLPGAKLIDTFYERSTKVNLIRERTAFETKRSVGFHVDFVSRRFSFLGANAAKYLNGTVRRETGNTPDP